MEKSIGNAARWLARLGSIAALLGLAACGGGGGGGSPATGTVRMSMIDAQCGYRNVFVNVREVRIQRSPTAGDNDGGWITIPVPGGPKRVDLLTLTNGTLLDLGGATVQAGTYEQLRLVLEDTGNEVVLNTGVAQPLKTPSAQQSGLKIKAPYTVAPNTTSDFLLDFDACKSIVVAGNSGQWILKPVVRLTPKFTGAIEGFVGTGTLGTNTSVSAQLPTGEIYRTAIVDGTGKFVLPYLESGTYTVVITSDARQTTVVTSVPVGTTTTTLNTSASALPLATSATATVNGTVSGASVIIVGTGSNAISTVDADVTATQTLTGGPTITVKTAEVVTTNAATGTGTYSMTLPVTAPAKVTYSTTLGTLLTDAAVADRYTLTATSPGEAPISTLVPVATTTTPVNFTFP
ncbi:DUF4382 domain-containing protein [Ramlibacter montanisoli]|uniref:DUF4382 domain-containing protein n=1 Tax=Ramlibacter montanisoli TaxID=2732512 RepID=A0A849KAZ3_9BURK|nr:DUF4382 domain-containing protein [Ramlibacter montanisoli]NNU43317.1 DUF4382 domain-containing protein [Ramlibacter montanisoli]